MNLYSIRDVVAETFSPPFLQENDRSANRSFRIQLEKASIEPADFELWCVAAWCPSKEVLLVVDIRKVTFDSIAKEFEKDAPN